MFDVGLPQLVLVGTGTPVVVDQAEQVALVGRYRVPRNVLEVNRVREERLELPADDLLSRKQGFALLMLLIEKTLSGPVLRGFDERRRGLFTRRVRLRLASGKVRRGSFDGRRR